MHNTTLPGTECEEYTCFKLGYGIDATNSFLNISNINFKVRYVLEDVSNVQESKGIEMETYEDFIDSSTAYTAAVTTSISASSHLQMRGEVKYGRDNTYQTIAKGIHVIMINNTYASEIA